MEMERVDVEEGEEALWRLCIGDLQWQPVNIFLRCMNPIFVVVVGVQYFREVQVVFSLMATVVVNGGCVVAKIQSDPWNVHLRQQDNRNSIINRSCEAYGDPCVNSKEKEEEGN